MGKTVSGDFVRLDGADYYCIQNYDQLAPFFMTVVSGADHWLFVSSTGGMTTGRINSEHALFPYETVDKIHESATHTGPVTVIRVRTREAVTLWTPFDTTSLETDTERNLYKHVLGTSLLFEEKKKNLGLTFRAELCTSERYGFVRRATLTNTSGHAVEVEVLDGVRNVLPAGVELALQQAFSSLTDAYKTAEVDPELGIALYSLTAAISDKAEPLESLKCSAVWSRGLPRARYSLDPAHVQAFRRDLPFVDAHELKGKKGAFLATSRFTLDAGESQRWVLVGDVNLGQAEVVRLERELLGEADLVEQLAADVARGQLELERILGASDGLQLGGDPRSTAHHAANVLFNDMRGGIFAQGYELERDDFVAFLGERSRATRARSEGVLAKLPKTVSVQTLLSACQTSGDADLMRLGLEYLPLMFSRRHGDPSRPWNRFNIRLRGPGGERLINYEGNWRDIFQNWEALCFSYPAFLPSIIAKFVNASTLDGYNPYRVSRSGIDWETPEPHSAWANIGYWGDHQVVYLLRLVEWCERFYPGRLESLLRASCFSYADVPYRIKPYAELLCDARNSIDFDHEKNRETHARERDVGSDARLVSDASGRVVHVNLAEKLAVTMLSKLSNLVVGGGIWLNTQRPEWNDANNALVGSAASMVTLYHLRRYQRTFAELLRPLAGSTLSFSREVATWFQRVAAAYEAEAGRVLSTPDVDDAVRKALLDRLGEAFSDYRTQVYAHGLSDKVELSVDALLAFTERSLAFIDHSIRAGKRENGLYDAYNLLTIREDGVGVRRLYDMLEGQVSALSSGELDPAEAATLLATMEKSALYREDQHSYLLYPVRKLGSYLERNRIAPELAARSRLIAALVDRGDTQLVVRDEAGTYRFQASIAGAGDVRRALDAYEKQEGLADLARAERALVLELYEVVFKHAEFTGRSGRMYGYEGLGCIYWHMVAKLLVAAQENAIAARDAGHPQADTLAQAYLRVRSGLCFNKEPTEYGAFPMDPYSHTPPFAGAQQPGMTGQVKEVVLTRFGELGVRVHDGKVSFAPVLLRRAELLEKAAPFRYLALDGTFRSVDVEAGELAFTYCQVPVVYAVGEQKSLTVLHRGSTLTFGATDTLTAELSSELFARSGAISAIRVTVPREFLLA